jgi:hypothetical protein
VIEQWRKHDNTKRPHSVLRYRPRRPNPPNPLSRWTKSPS